MRPITLHAEYYQQFDADPTRNVPGEGYGGWQSAPLTLDLEHTALVLMHAWETGTQEQYPGWYRAVEYIPRAQAILTQIIPGLLAATRRAGMTLFHVVGGGHYYQNYPGYQRACALAAPAPVQARVAADPTSEELRRFRARYVSVGEHNRADTDRGFAVLDFPPSARPLGDEGIAEEGAQLTALCQDAGINHLIYAGFAINWCLLMSPGGMVDMSRAGVICSALRQAVTAVENRESARTEAHKEEALWRVALAFGFVFDVDDFVTQLDQTHLSERADRVNE
jgi:hypothetical protein